MDSTRQSMYTNMNSKEPGNKDRLAKLEHLAKLMDDNPQNYSVRKTRQTRTLLKAARNGQYPKGYTVDHLITEKQSALKQKYWDTLPKTKQHEEEDIATLQKQKKLWNERYSTIHKRLEEEQKNKDGIETLIKRLERDMRPERRARAVFYEPRLPSLLDKAKDMLRALGSQAVGQTANAASHAANHLATDAQNVDLNDVTPPDQQFAHFGDELADYQFLTDPLFGTNSKDFEGATLDNLKELSQITANHALA